MPFGVAEVLPEPLVGETGAPVGQSGTKRLLGPLGEAGLLGAVAKGDDRVAQQVGSPRVVQRLGESLGIPEQRRRRERVRDRSARAGWTETLRLATQHSHLPSKNPQLRRQKIELNEDIMLSLRKETNCLKYIEEQENPELVFTRGKRRTPRVITISNGVRASAPLPRRAGEGTGGEGELSATHGLRRGLQSVARSAG